MPYETGYDAIHMYLSDVSSHLVAKTGIPTDRYHLGKILLHCFQDDPDFILQIDGAKDITETAGSVLDRSVRCAIAFKKLGLEKGDVIILTGLNHIDLCIPYYAALYLGVVVAAIDPTFGVNELRDAFTITKPKIIFCEGNKTDVIEKALKCAELEAKIAVFSEGNEFMTLSKCIMNIDDNAVKEFRPSDFDPEETPALLTSTSGTTGLPKAAILTHKNLFIGLSYMWLSLGSKFPTPTNIILSVSPIQWLTATFVKLFSPILKVTRLQSSEIMNPELFVHLVNKYKPAYIITSPLTFQNALASNDKCDFTCFKSILLGGLPVSPDLVDKLKELAQTERVYSVYGMSEISGPALQHNFPAVKGSCGHAAGHLEYRLVDPDTKEDVISKANTPGELWLRGPSVFKGYYKDPEMTANTLTEDGWFMTGDILYRDDYWHFYFVDRIKSLLKYKSYQISPSEVEAVIKKHPGVLHVFVTGIPDENCGDLVVACVIPKPGSKPSAQEIKDIVKESLSDSKQLRGGVVFFKEFPITSNLKINKKKLQDMVLTMDRE
ncbi:unnamed protein product [Arctia plantaginis]|uniref:Luciferin 4-monooxygenase-like n=1 Tax=Arctia plantaginis TaxID=874455 RepID=A0A8S1AE28_ARCPL|nr:unnamed protein product [Arctia plantaginis]